jgi:hypothetical protein
MVLGQGGGDRAGIKHLLAGRQGLGEGLHRKLEQVPQHDLLEVEPRVPAAPDRADQGVARVEEHTVEAHLDHPRDARGTASTVAIVRPITPIASGTGPMGVGSSADA